VSGIIGGAGTNSGVITENRGLEVHEWLLSSSFNGTSFTDWNAMTGWVVCPTTYGYKTIGGAMSESSGIFTFPRTGMYLIFLRLSFKQNSGTGTCTALISTTLNNGSNWSWANGGVQNTHTGVGTNSYSAHTSEAFFNVTNTSTHKVRFIMGDAKYSGDDFTVAGSSNGNDGQTAVKFMRIGR
jgi:hypothetical protein